MGYRRYNNDRDDERRRPPMKGKGRGPTQVELDYRKPETLKPFLDDFGRIRPRRQTRLDGRAQRKLAREVKRSRHIALLPFVDNR